MSKPSLIYFYLSSMKLTAKLSDELGDPLTSATVICTVKDIRDTDIDTSSMASPIVWPVTLIETTPGRYDYTFDSDFPLGKGDRVKGSTTITKGTSKRYAEAAIIVKIDEH